MPSSTVFTPAVVIETLIVGRLRVVTGARVAAEMLLGEWPEEKRTGAAYADATRAVLAALEGTGSAFAARKAFVRAAKEAGIFVREAEPGGKR